MTDIDRTADMEVSRGFAQVTVRIPLTGHVSQEWVSRFGNRRASGWLTRGTRTPFTGMARTSSRLRTYLTTGAGSSSGFPLLLIAP